MGGYEFGNRLNNISADVIFCVWCHKYIRTNIRRVPHQSPSISALPEHPFLGMSQWRSW